LDACQTASPFLMFSGFLLLYFLKSVFFADSPDWESVLHSFLSIFFVLANRRKMSFLYRLFYYMHTFRRIYGEQNLFPSRHKENGSQKEI